VAKQNQTSRFRCDLRDFLLDLLDFVEEQIEQAVSEPADQRAAVDAASGVVPVIRDRLNSDPSPQVEALWASFLLVPGNKFEERYWRTEWDALEIMAPDDFREAARVLIELIETLRQVVRARLG